MEGNFRDHWRKGPKFLQVKILKIWPMVAPGKAKPGFWSHSSQKDRFVIFCYGALKTGKKSWGETSGTTSVKFRSENEIPRWHSATKVHGWHFVVQSASPAHRTRWVKMENFDLGRVFRFGLLRRWSPSKIFYPFWAAHGQKLRIGLFDCCATISLPRSFWPMVRLMGVKHWVQGIVKMAH